MSQRHEKTRKRHEKTSEKTCEKTRKDAQEYLVCKFQGSISHSSIGIEGSSCVTKTRKDSKKTRKDI